jgi:hypothetical protein
MDDKNPRLGDERIGGRGDDSITGREGAASGDYTTSPGDTRNRAGSMDSTANSSYVSNPGSDVEPDQRTRDIRRDIEQTRGDLSETVNAIQERLTPRNIASNAAESVRSAAAEKAREFSDSESIHYVRANPIPTTMIGIGVAGLAWLAFGGRDAGDSRRRAYERNTHDWRVEPGSYGRDEYYRRNSGSYRPVNAYAPGTSYDTDRSNTSRGLTDDLSSRASEMADDLSRNVRRTTERTRNQVQRAWDQNPLLIGAASAVLGAIVGMAVPETARENELMGETRDNMIEEVQQTVREKVEDARQAATSAVEKVQSAVGLASDTSSRETPGAESADRQRKRGARTTTNVLIEVRGRRLREVVAPRHRYGGRQPALHERMHDLRSDRADQRVGQESRRLCERRVVAD